MTSMKTLRDGVVARPAHPGLAVAGFIKRIGVTQDELAKAMKVSRFTVNQLVRGRRNITPEMALRLAKVSGTTEDFWLNQQREVDLFDARQELGGQLDELVVLRRSDAPVEILEIEDD
ncbi:HigA family addiction module antitoxin [Rhizobium leguminosarum]|uniref:HigA family addiction module antitoxin n=1 Tax=Rhizobium leguminosarum TaxID=384 RepID=UPI002E141A15|nr:HigA family addiction module antitoxin [Rhizobium leguminosarum]WSH77686.1 HigA family addiction module antitoxin [Rhizobium leguminosarum]